MAAPPPNPWATRMIRHTLNLAAWTAAWAASLALAAFGPGSIWDQQSAATALAIAFNVLIGIGMLIANKRHLQALDELQRTIQLQAMAWALGAGLVAGMAWTLLDRYGLIAFDASIAHLVIFMSLVYITGIVVTTKRYL